MRNDRAIADFTFPQVGRTRRADRILATLAMMMVVLFAATQMACDSGELASTETAATSSEAATPEGDAPSEDETIQAQRLVVLGGPIAEIAFALGAEDRVVAADKSAEYPPEAAEIATLDYYRQTSAEAVLSKRPTRVLASEGVGPAEVVDQLRAAGVEVLMFEEPTDIASARERILEVGKALERSEQAVALVAELDAALEKAEASSAQVPEDLRAIFIYARGPGTLLVGGRGTSAATAIELAGADLVTEYDDFRPMSAEGVIAAKPDVIVMTAKGLGSIGGPEKVFELPGMSQTPAAATRRVVVIDDLKLLGYGPRLGEAVSELSKGFLKV